MWTTVLLLGLLVFIYRFSKAKPHFPKGPRLNLPLLGHTPFMRNKLHYEYYTELSQKYGHVFSVRLLTKNAIVLNSYETIRDAFKSKTVSGRFSNYYTQVRSEGMHGLLFNEGPQWMELRRFTLRTLRDFGMGKTNLEHVIQREVLELIDFLKSEQNEPVTFINRINASILNTLWTIIMGERLSLTDPVFLDITKKLSNFFSNIGVSGPALILPYKKWIPPGLIGLSEKIATDRQIKQILNEAIAKHQKEHDLTNPSDFIHAFLKEMQETTDSSSAFYGSEAITQLRITLVDFFVGGSETTSTTINWFVFLIAAHPQVQDKIHQEIDNVLGKSRFPSIRDCQLMPYLEAVLLETQRLGSVVPVTPHKTTENTEIAGYQIPKNTMVMANLYAVHRDPRIWKHPNQFHPQHFLTPEGKIKYNDALIPFSVGQRMCLGESLARMQTFLFACGLVQAFRFHLVSDGSKPELKATGNFFRSPPPFQVRITVR